MNFNDFCIIAMYVFWSAYKFVLNSFAGAHIHIEFKLISDNIDVKSMPSFYFLAAFQK